MYDYAVSSHHPPLPPPPNSQLYPPILLLDEVYECHALEQILDAASSLCKRPYIIATLCSGNTKGIPLHQLLFHHQIRYKDAPIIVPLSHLAELSDIVLCVQALSFMTSVPI